MAVITRSQVESALNDLNIDMTKQQFTIESVMDGANVELEHGTISELTNITNDDILMTVKIALAHLNEQRASGWFTSKTVQNYDYYQGLDIIEDAPAGYWSINLHSRHYVTMLIAVLCILYIIADLPYANIVAGIGFVSIIATLFYTPYNANINV